jgi:hypothetical protein
MIREARGERRGEREETETSTGSARSGTSKILPLCADTGQLQRLEQALFMPLWKNDFPPIAPSTTGQAQRRRQKGTTERQEDLVGRKTSSAIKVPWTDPLLIGACKPQKLQACQLIEMQGLVSIKSLGLLGRKGGAGVDRKQAGGRIRSC